jgi:hypothetical protein
MKLKFSANTKRELIQKQQEIEVRSTSFASINDNVKGKRIQSEQKQEFLDFLRSFGGSLEYEGSWGLVFIPQEPSKPPEPQLLPSTS